MIDFLNFYLLDYIKLERKKYSYLFDITFFLYLLHIINIIICDTINIWLLINIFLLSIYFIWTYIKYITNRYKILKKDYCKL